MAFGYENCLTLPKTKREFCATNIFFWKKSIQIDGFFVVCRIKYEILFSSQKYSFDAWLVEFPRENNYNSNKERWWNGWISEN